MKNKTCVFLISLFILNIICNFPCKSKENFKNLQGWNVVKVNMVFDNVRNVLKKASIPFKENMFNKTGVNYITLMENNWEGTIYFDEEKDIVNKILFISPYIKNASEVKKITDSFTEKYGKPYEIKEISNGDAGTKDKFYIWKNKYIKLELTVTYYNSKKEWILMKSYEPIKNY